MPNLGTSSELASRPQTRAYELAGPRTCVQMTVHEEAMGSRRNGALSAPEPSGSPPVPRKRCVACIRAEAHMQGMSGKDVCVCDLRDRLHYIADDVVHCSRGRCEGVVGIDCEKGL